jgi:hypothetical protein
VEDVPVKDTVPPDGVNVPPIDKGVPEPERVIVLDVGESVPVTVST